MEAYFQAEAYNKTTTVNPCYTIDYSSNNLTIDMNLISTPDLCDQHPDKVNILDPIFNNYGGSHSFYGQVVTIKCHEDNSLV